MSRPACVLFDLDDTLVRYDHEARLRTLATRCGVEPARVADALTASGLERDSDLGLFDADGHARALAQRLGVPVTLDDCIAARAASMTPLDETLALAGAIARNAALAILTNNGLMVRDHLSALCPALSPLFNGRVLCSAELGVGKPDPAIFLWAAQRLGLAPAQVLFVDDKATNVAAAAACGMRAHWYRDASTLRPVLLELGLLQPDTLLA